MALQKERVADFSQNVNSQKLWQPNRKSFLQPHHILQAYELLVQDLQMSLLNEYAAMAAWV